MSQVHSYYGSLIIGTRSICVSSDYVDLYVCTAYVHTYAGKFGPLWVQIFRYISVLMLIPFDVEEPTSAR